MISIKRFKFNFINIPKNASTSIRRFFIANVVQPEDAYSNSYDPYNMVWAQNMATEHARHSHMDVTYAIDNGLLNPTETIVGVIRHPLERVLSLYLYRAKQGLIPNASVADFRKMVEPGFYPDRTWQNQLQSSFLTYRGEEIGQWWLFDNIQKHVTEFVETYNIKVSEPLQWANKSLKNFDTKEYVTVFYDDASIKSVNKYYEKDIELYERLKCSL